MRCANGSNDNVSLLEEVLKVGGLGVADSNGGISVAEQVADRAANNVAAANDNSRLSGQRNTSFVEEVHDTLGGARRENGGAAALGELTNVVGAEPVDILLVSHGRGDVVL